MADISRITLPSGTTYELKDAVARQTMAGAIILKGTTTTTLSDEATTNPIKIDNADYTAKANDAVFYNKKEFVFDGTKWHEFGDMSGLGSLATKNSASATYKPAGTVSKPTFTGSASNVTFTIASNSNGNYTPAGTISQPTFSNGAVSGSATYTPKGDIAVTTKSTSNKTATVAPASSGTATYTPAGTVAAPTISVKTAGTTTTVKNPTSVTVAKTVVAAAPGATAPANAVTYYSVSDETLSLYQLGYTTGDSITTSNVTVKTGDAAYSATAPGFTGTGVRLVTENIAVPSEYTATFTGTEETVDVTGTATGTVSTPTFTGTKVNITGTTTAAGSVSQPTFDGTQATITVS